jgi:hypothetical protein
MDDGNTAGTTVNYNGFIWCGICGKWVPTDLPHYCPGTPELTPYTNFQWMTCWNCALALNCKKAQLPTCFEEKDGISQ